MNIRIEGREYPISSACLVNGQKVAKLRSELEVHGVEAFATSKKLSPYMACLLFELIEGGAEIVFDEQAGEPRVDPPTVSQETVERGMSPDLGSDRIITGEQSGA